MAIATISSWDTGERVARAAVTVATNVQTVFGAIETGGESIVGFNANSLYAAPTAGGGTPVTLDENAESFFLVSSGAAAVYTTSAEALRRTPTAMAGYTTLVASGFTVLKALSLNDKWIVGYKTKAASGTSDLYASSTTTADAPITLTTATTAAISAPAVMPFTADSTYALYQAGYSGSSRDAHRRRTQRRRNLAYHRQRELCDVGRLGHGHRVQRKLREQAADIRRQWTWRRPPPP